MAERVEIRLIDHQGRSHPLQVEVGQSIMEAAVVAGIAGVPAECGGAPQCGTCSVFVPEEWVARTGQADELEQVVLRINGKLEPRRRLSCQLVAQASWQGMTLTIPESQY